MICVKSNIAITISVGAALVILGVALKNGRAQRGTNVSLISPGTLAFVVGWLIVAYGMSLSGSDYKFATSNKSYLSAAAAASIMGAVFLMKAAKKGVVSKQVAAIAQVLFVGGWLLMGYTSSLKMHNVGLMPKIANIDKQKAIYGVSAVALVLLSMMVVLPNERAAKVTDTVGMPMFAAGWAGIVLANSLVSH